MLTSNLIARRWKADNGIDPFVANSVGGEDDAEEKWRLSIIEDLIKLHTPGGIGSAEFEIVESNYSVCPFLSSRHLILYCVYQDLAFKIEHGTFKWTWETCFLGHRYSSEIISKHLVLPLISFSHLSLSAGSPVGEMSDSDLEKVCPTVAPAMALVILDAGD